MTKTVLISGGGIAGPALAYWLRRHGFTPTIVEIAPAPRPGGQTIDIRGISKVVVERMGLMPAIKEAQLHERGLEYVRANGRRAAAMPVELLDGAGAVAEIEILRGDLASILQQATTGVAYLYGDSISALDQDAQGVLVTFTSGLQRRFDLVVGADGVHSKTRRLAFGPEEQFVQHLGGYTSYFTVETPEPLDHWMRIHSARGGRWVGLRPDHDPRYAKALLSFRAPLLSYDRRDVEAQKALLTERFTGLGWHTDHILAGMRAANDFYFDTISRVVVPEWSRGRVVLVGDAGYCGSPLAGHGTALSLVGAYVLAGELAAAEGDHVRAFPSYQKIMQAYVEQRMELPPGGIKMAMPMTSLGIRLRDTSTRLMTSRPFAGLLAKLAVGQPDKIELKDYSVKRGDPVGVAAEEAE
ncbi:2-polyprenyl-6-methoxyphenol hydroxylase-like FAD-dependent oxidoreductase [Kribbella antiqua]|uniref:2-polyprenyl-6-methoxyphenol hydroxylase-like FAD-dependent oxidoreductase n=1 Tax=Kribbella antiqua TaxID=2512217 RepID=A0A4R2IU12_9ACTN|nr:FAD-dependent monooxygenase [Kribbella antiqua]TCO48557.1 2-polyprenyl-6-methoxyphenol hydroxylase-like FAD-dependent oxidoreductase [Kribbella antiqua]